MEKRQPPLMDFDSASLVAAAQYPGQKQACENLQAIAAAVQDAAATVVELQDAAIANVRLNPDGSPTSDADETSHNILTAMLTTVFPTIPAGGEEAGTATTENALASSCCWLTDGLDGTKDYLRRSNDYAICVGLLEVVDLGESGTWLTPTFGMVAAPAHGEIYFGGPGIGSYKQDADGHVHPIQVSPEPTNVITTSQSHPNAKTEAYIAAHYPNAHIEQRGSAYKLLMISEGLADACPRINVTMKGWDIAAAHAILAGAGGRVTKPDGNPIDYRRIIIPEFVASR